MPSTARLARLERNLDRIGLILLVAGGSLFAWAWLGFQRMDGIALPAGSPEGAAVAMADGYARLHDIGVAVMVAALVVLLVGWWVGRRARALTPDSAPTPDRPSRPGAPGERPPRDS